MTDIIEDTKKCAERQVFHCVKELFDSANGNTNDVKKLCIAYTGLTYRTIQRYYSGERDTLSVDKASLFLGFFNSIRSKELPKLEPSDIIVNIAEKVS